MIKPRSLPPWSSQPCFLMSLSDLGGLMVRTGSGAISQWQHREADTWGMKAKSPDTVRMLTHTQNLLPLINVIGHGEVNQAQ